MSKSKDFSRFEIKSAKDDGLIVMPAFDVVLYTTKLLTEIGPAVLAAYDKYLAMVPTDSLAWHLTENMAKHKPVTPRVLKLLETWLRPGAPKREMVNIELRGGDDFTVPTDLTFFVLGREKAHLRHEMAANSVRFVFPVNWGSERVADLGRFVRQICEIFPYQSGHAGYVLQTSKYVQEESEEAAWRLSMRYRGLDIRNEVRDNIAVRDSIKGVNWLTILSDELLGELGGSSKLRATLKGSGVDVNAVTGGVILQAGKGPVIGDVDAGEDLAPYEAVYAAVEPLMSKTLDRYGSFLLSGGGHVEKTERWLTRLSHA